MADAAHPLPVLLGVIAAVTVAAGAAMLTPRMRSRLYRHEKGSKSDGASTAGPDPGRSAEEQAEDAATKALLMAEHRAAIDLQVRTLRHLMSVAASLTAAFLCTALAATVLSEAHDFHLFAATLDVAAFGLVLWSFVMATRCRKSWLASRAVTEMLRQWSVVDRILLAPDDFELGFKAMRDRARNALRAHDRDFAAVVLRFGRLRLEEIGEALSALPAVPAGRVRYYLDRRPARQRRWFATAEARVSGQGKRHRRTLMILFAFATVAALVKVALLLGWLRWPGAVDWTMLALLVLIGLSATLTSVYLNQNIRSLSHRYRSQSRNIAWWFERHESLIEAAERSEPLSGPLASQLAAAVVEFETLMVDELVDWIVITDHDSLEIAAA